MTLLSLSRQIRAALDRQDAAEFKRLSVSYQAMVDRLEGDVDALSQDIAGGDYTGRSVRRLDSYRRLMRDTERELDDYTKYLLEELALVAALWLGLGVANSDALLAEAFASAGVEREIVSFNDAVINALNRYLEKDSPLHARLMRYTRANLDRIRQIVIDSVRAGLNPRQLARLIVRDGFGMGLTDALRMARTLQLYAYRDATLLNYRQYGDIVEGWVWSSALIPGRTCMSCVNMHGTIHGLDETLNDHHNGLCAMIPYLGGENPVRERGEAWYRRQSEAVQIRMMGKEKHAAWMAGKFTFSQLTTERDDPVYGLMKHERSLKDLLEGSNP